MSPAPSPPISSLLATSVAPPLDGLPHGLKGPMDLGLAWLWWVIFSILILLAMGALWWWWRQRNRVPAEMPARRLSVDDLLRELDAQHVAEPFDEEQQMQFCLQLSWLLRSALELQSKLPFTDRTGAELPVLIRRCTSLQPQDREAVLGFLQTAEEITYGHRRLDAATASTWQQQVRYWLRRLAAAGHASGLGVQS